MADDLIEVAEVESIANDLENAGIAGSTGVSQAAVEEGLAARMGQENGFVQIDRDGTVKVNGEEVKTPEALRDVMNNLPANKLQQFRDALGNDGLGNEKPEVIQKATKLGAENNQSDLLKNAFDSLSGTLEDKYNSLIKKLQNSNTSFMSKLLKYTSLAGASYLTLSAIAAGKTGCYGVYNGQQQMVYKQGKSQADCVYYTGTAPNPPGDAALTAQVPGLCNANACSVFIQGSTAATLAQLTKDAQNQSCNCVDSSGKLVQPNVALNYQQPTVWDVFGGVVNGIGGFITKLADGTLQVLEAAADVVGDIPKILMWAGIGLAIVGVIAGLAFLGKKLHDKKKLKGGYWKPRHDKHYKQNMHHHKSKDFKHWKKSMKQIQKHTPMEHLTLGQSLF